MISQIFILSERGDILIKRFLRNDLTPTTPEIFFRRTKLYKNTPTPIFTERIGNKFFFDQKIINIHRVYISF